MNLNRILAASAGLALAAITLSAASLRIRPADCVVVVPTGDAFFEETAQDLAKHFRLVFGVELQAVSPTNLPGGKFPLRLGEPAPGDTKPLASGECRWTATPEGLWFYGSADPAWRQKSEAEAAVYFFLEQAMGVRWIQPGDRGLVYAPRKELMLKKGTVAHVNKMVYRGYRAGAARPLPEGPLKPIAGPLKGFDAWFHKPGTVATYNQYVEDERQWRLRRMRMGGVSPGYGHAFTDWWDAYSETHAEYFALNRHGAREPERDPALKGVPWSARDKQFVKLCVSSPGVVEQVIANWRKKGMRGSVNATENDLGIGYCHCGPCMALDRLDPGDYEGKTLASVTDRYVWFANRLARAAAAFKPGTEAAMYVYNECYQPPKYETVDPQVVAGVVPRRIDLTHLEEILGGWKKAGLRKMMLRPNWPFHYGCSSLPFGHHQQLYEAFRCAYRHGAVSADIDHLMLQWTIHGLADYALCKGMLYPDAPFERWEAEYCSAFGDAAEDARAYFRYWQERVWEARILPDYDAIVRSDPVDNFLRAIWRRGLGAYFKDADFDAADALVEAGLKKQLTPLERERLESLRLLNGDSRRVIRAAAAEDGPEKYRATRDLIAYRDVHHAAYGIDLPRAMVNEITLDRDNLYTDARTLLLDYPLPWTRLPGRWYFALDRDNRGLAEGWPDKTEDAIRRLPMLAATAPRYSPGDTDPALKQALAADEGPGWYFIAQPLPPELNGKPVFLLFPELSRNAEIFVNGRSMHRQQGDTPVAADITKALDGGQTNLLIAVRQEGRQGLTRRPWLAGR